MGMIPQVTCRNCRKKYSKLKRHCPYCGLERVKQSTRTPASTASTIKESSASQRAKNTNQYRVIFCAVLLLAIVGSTIAMVSVSIHRSDAAGKQETAQTEQKQKDGGAKTALSDDKKDSKKDSEDQKGQSADNNDDTGSDDDASSTSTTSVSITYLSAEKTEFSMSIGDAIQLGATVYPLDDSKEVTWASSNTAVITVTDGLVTGVSSGEANVIASCDGVEAVCRVLVW